MFKKLQQKWGVSGWGMALIIATFALGGSACARVSGFLLQNTGLEKGLLWWICYVLLLTLTWPICVIIISIPLGQYRFFSSYLRRVWTKISGKK